MRTLESAFLDWFTPEEDEAWAHLQEQEMTKDVTVTVTVNIKYHGEYVHHDPYRYWWWAIPVCDGDSYTLRDTSAT